ncbi:hypothetical protein GLOIN_2v1632945, partial [Rhizophagus irregularis DAOM 181602=DAOM 197198]
THFTYDDVVGSLTDEERDDINKTQLLEMNTNESSDSSCGTWQVMISLNPSSNISELETSEINVIDFDAKNLDQQFMLSNWTTKYPSTFIKFYSNRGMNIRSFDSKYYSQSLKDIGLRPHTIFGCVVDYLFRPAPSALSFITHTKIEHFVVSELPANSNLDNLHNPDNVINAMIESWIFSKTDYRVDNFIRNYGKLSAFHSKQLHTTISICN